MSELRKVTENIVRERPNAESAQVNASDEGRTLFGHFSVTNTWYEVNSRYEGRFLERVAPGGFNRTLQERRDHIKAQFQHGQDPHVGGSVLGTFSELREDEVGGYYSIDLIDTDYNRDRIIPQARAGLLGASFRFSIADGGDEWVENPGESEHNPLGLPERTITDTDVFELGPVVFGANPAATASLRSGTDAFIDRLLDDPLFLARFAERVGAPNVEKLFAQLPLDERDTRQPNPDAAQQGTSGVSPESRTAWFRSLTLKEPNNERHRRPAG